ncbi:hypothetical protein HPB50_023652 [Hyalomma asiaticum]|uniref:Uncharacterized protein n=1 Tax=Hyalomma asiaticum TaxID=266040 RepID=A0ACB7T6G6_HYAAI|nr:hypothetical protein HPB50_023652 [Hyalomma asiaticum]
MGAGLSLADSGRTLRPPPNRSLALPSEDQSARDGQQATAAGYARRPGSLPRTAPYISAVLQGRSPEFNRLTVTLKGRDSLEAGA